MRKLKVRVTQIVEVDADAWAMLSGCGESMTEIAEDVRTHALTLIQGSAMVEDCKGTAEREE